LALLHALENEVHAMLVLALHAAEPGTHVVFLSYTLLSPLQGNVALPGVSVDTVVVVLGALAQHFLGDGADTQHFAEEIDGVLRACQGGQIAVDGHAVEAVVYANKSRPANSSWKNSI